MKTQYDEYDEYHEKLQLQEQLDNIEIQWSGPGLYWFVGPDIGCETELGTCYSEEEVRNCLKFCLEYEPYEDWSDWHVARDWRDEPIDDLKINFDGPGDYVLEDLWCNQTALGWCDTDADLRSALRRVVEETAYLVNPGRHNARYQPEDWTGWTVYRIDK